MTAARARKEEFNHKEAFCLMWYRCEECGHQERLWNSRDGVTPFGMGCPSCGGYNLLHWRWELDEYAPDHQLRPFQRYWRDGTKEEARSALLRRFGVFEKKGQPVPDDTKKDMLADLDKPSDERWEFKDGWPFVAVHLPEATS